MTTVKIVTYAFRCDFQAHGRRCLHMTDEITPFPYGSGVAGARREVKSRGWTFTTGGKWSRGLRAWCPDHPRGVAT